MSINKLTSIIIVIWIVGKEASTMKICRQNKLFLLEPVYDCLCLRLCRICLFLKEVWKIPVQVELVGIISGKK